MSYWINVFTSTLFLGVGALLIFVSTLPTMAFYISHYNLSYAYLGIIHLALGLFIFRWGWLITNRRIARNA
jgi:hypothetical protein